MRGRIRRTWESLVGTADLRRHVDALEHRHADLRRDFAGMEAAHHETRGLVDELALHRDLLAFDLVLAALPVTPGPTVTVVLATRDRAGLLPRAIASVEAQTYERWELVVVDDGSTDGTADLLAGIDDPRVVVVRGAGEGCSAARNRALDVAAGDIVTYLDDDNVLHPRWLEAVVWGFDRRPDVDVLYGARIADDYGRTHREPTSGTPWVNLLRWDRARLESENLADMGALAHRAGLPDARFDPSLVCSGDWDLLLRLTEHRDPLVLPAVACIYTTDSSGRLSDEHGHDHWDAVVRDLLGRRRAERREPQEEPT